MNELSPEEFQDIEKDMQNQDPSSVQRSQV